MEIFVANILAQGEPITPTVTSTATAVVETVLTDPVAASTPLLWYLAPLAAVVALFTAAWLYNNIMNEDEGTPTMIEIAQAVREGAMAYLTAQARYIGMVFIGLFVIFGILAVMGVQDPAMPIAFLTAGAWSALAGFIGMRAATNASARTTNAARTSLNGALQIAFRGGAVLGLSVVGMALLDSSIWFLALYNLFGYSVAELTNVMLSAAVGASTVALFARVGGGIYTKAADVGADLVGKVEAGIPEDDPRNPATIADNVGDNVGDVAGMGADLYESYFASLVAAASLGVAAAVAGQATPEQQISYFAAPFVLAGLGAIISTVCTYFVQVKEGASTRELMHALEYPTWIAGAGTAVLSYIFIDMLALSQHSTGQVWACIILGLLVGIGIGRATEYYTSADFPPTQGIAAQTATGPGTVIIDGLAVGMRSIAIPVLLVVLGTGGAFFIAAGDLTHLTTDPRVSLQGLFGVAMAAVGMLSTLAITLATDAYGPIADNAGGNAEMSGLPPEVRHKTDQLDSLGNTTAAIGKGFAIGSAALTGLALLASYMDQVRVNLLAQKLKEVAALGQNPSAEAVHAIMNVEILEGITANVEVMGARDFMLYYNVTPLNPLFLLGSFLGAMVAFYFCALTMSAVGRAAFSMVEEVRRQFREFPGIMTGEQKPDYATCVTISTEAALKEMVVPSLLAILVPALTGFLLGVAGVLGLLTGSLATAFSLAIMMSNAGGAWDNAKKYIEAGHHGGKGSPNHKAAVVGDTVGDPFKDTSGPSLNILIKLMSIVSIVFAGATLYFANGQGLIIYLLQ